MTVFAHFDRKEDLLLDRIPGALDVVRDAVRERPDDVGGAGEAIRRTVFALVDERHPLSGLTEGTEPSLRTVTASPALLSRLRTFAYEVETELSAALDADPRFPGDSALTAALLVAAYRTVAVETARRRLVGDDPAEIEAAHRERLEAAFEVLTGGLPGRSRPPRDA
ncbi:TetR family transcriptional regulator [Streptomyces sp. NPDC059786]|uniref:TetR family transcriptional regulator n=1 Tax=Streptomyces sp. NPDC059786 TaxID=3346946 RepID=UPI0036471361